MLPGQQLRFRVLFDIAGKPRHAYGPVLLKGTSPVMVRCTLLPDTSPASSGRLLLNVETLDVPWSDYQKANVVIYQFVRVEKTLTPKEGQ